jgi:Zn-dependent protease
MFEDVLHGITVWAVPVILAVTLHEIAHGRVAMRCGDDTAFLARRLSLNPLRHVSLVGTVLVPALLVMTTPFLFGWAKPVPVNFRKLLNPRRDMVLVAAAGPATNLVLAVVSAALMHGIVYFPDSAQLLGENLRNSVIINLVLAVFNMLPIPPLDGGRVAVGLLPEWLGRSLAGLERVGLLIIIGVLFVLPSIGNYFGIDLNVFLWLVQAPVESLFRAVMFVTGHG